MYARAYMSEYMFACLIYGSYGTMNNIVIQKEEK